MVNTANTENVTPLVTSDPAPASPGLQEHAASAPASEEAESPTILKEKKGLFSGIETKVKEWRGHTIAASPNFLVNNSSNILGATHVATEIMMLKASSARSGRGLIRPNPQWHHYITDPITNTFESAIVDSLPQHSFKTMMKGNPLTNFKDYLTDKDRASSNFEYENVLPKLNKREEKKNWAITTEDKFSPANRWQSRSTLFGLGVWTLSALIPDKKENPEEVERMAELQQGNPIRYLGERVRQAVWVPEWREHKRQMIGLGVTMSGICSVLGAWRGRDKGAMNSIVNGIKYTHSTAYLKDTSYLIQSMFTLGSGAALLFSLDDERGYSRFGMGMMGRLSLLPITIGKKFGYRDELGKFSWDRRAPEPGHLWYTGATVSFQAENMAQGLIGGAEKDPDGTIIDHAKIRQQAKLKAKIIVNAKKLGEPITDDEVDARIKRIRDANPQQYTPSSATDTDDVPQRPATRVTAATSEKAMPELAAQQALAMQA